MFYDASDIKKAQEERRNNILKSFGADDDSIEKARSGIYADTAENRKLGRVGREYGKKKESNNQDNQRLSNKQKGEIDISTVPYADGGDFFDAYYAIVDNGEIDLRELKKIDKYIEDNNLSGLDEKHQVQNFDNLPIKHKMKLADMMETVIEGLSDREDFDTNGLLENYSKNLKKE